MDECRDDAVQRGSFGRHGQDGAGALGLYGFPDLPRFAGFELGPGSIRQSHPVRVFAAGDFAAGGGPSVKFGYDTHESSSARSGLTGLVQRWFLWTGAVEDGCGGRCDGARAVPGCS